jgi:hypothetical protein
MRIQIFLFSNLIVCQKYIKVVREFICVFALELTLSHTKHSFRFVFLSKPESRSSKTTGSEVESDHNSSTHYVRVLFVASLPFPLIVYFEINKRRGNIRWSSTKFILDIKSSHSVDDKHHEHRYFADDESCSRRHPSPLIGRCCSPAALPAPPAASRARSADVPDFGGEMKRIISQILLISVKRSSHALSTVFSDIIKTHQSCVLPLWRSCLTLVSMILGR